MSDRNVADRQSFFHALGANYEFSEVDDKTALGRLYATLADYSNVDQLGRMNFSQPNERSLGNHQAVMQGRHNMSTQSAFTHFGFNDDAKYSETRPLSEIHEVAAQEKLKKAVEVQMAALYANTAAGVAANPTIELTQVLNGYDDNGKDGHVHNLARLVGGLMATTAGANAARADGRDSSSFMPGPEVWNEFGGNAAPNDWSIEQLVAAITPDADQRVHASIIFAKTMPLIPAARRTGALIVLSNFWREFCGLSGDYYNSGEACTYVRCFGQVGRVSVLMPLRAQRDAWMGLVPGVANGPAAHNGTRGYNGGLMEDPANWMAAIAVYAHLTGSARHLTAAANLVVTTQGRFLELPLTSASIPFDDTFVRGIIDGEEQDGNKVDEDDGPIMIPVTLERIVMKRLVHMWSAELKHRNHADNADIDVAQPQWPTHPYLGWKKTTFGANDAAGPARLAEALADEVFPGGHTANNTRRTYTDKAFARDTSAAGEGAAAAPTTRRTDWFAMRGVSGTVAAADALDALEIDAYWYDFFLNEKVRDVSGFRRVLATMPLAQRFDLLAWIADVNVAATTWAARWTDEDMGVVGVELRQRNQAEARVDINDLRRMLHLNPRFVGGSFLLSGSVNLESWCGVSRARAFMIGGGNVEATDAESVRTARLLLTTQAANLCSAIAHHMIIIRACSDVGSGLAGVTEGAQKATMANIQTSVEGYNEIADYLPDEHRVRTNLALQNDYYAFFSTTAARAGIYDIIPALHKAGAIHLDFSERIYLAPDEGANMYGEVVQRALLPSYLSFVLPKISVGGGLPNVGDISKLFGEEQGSVLSTLKCSGGLRLLEVAGYLEVLAGMGGMHYNNLRLRKTFTLEDSADVIECDFASELLSYPVRKSDLCPASLLGAVPNAWLLCVAVDKVRMLELEKVPCLVPVRDQNEVAFNGPQFMRVQYSPIQTSDRQRLPNSHYFKPRKATRHSGYTFAVRAPISGNADSLMEANMRRVSGAGAWQQQRALINVGKLRSANGDAFTNIVSVANVLPAGLSFDDGEFRRAAKRWDDEICNPNGSFVRVPEETFSGIALNATIARNTVRSKAGSARDVLHPLSRLAFSRVEDKLSARTYPLRFEMNYRTTLIPTARLTQQRDEETAANMNDGAVEVDGAGFVSVVSGQEGVAAILGTNTFAAQTRERLADVTGKRVVIGRSGLEEVRADKRAEGEVEVAGGDESLNE